MCWLRSRRIPSTMVTVMQNDNTNYCQCSVCTSAANAEGSQAGPVIRFVNAVAAGVKAQYPNVLVRTLAYEVQHYAAGGNKTGEQCPDPALRYRRRLCRTADQLSKCNYTNRAYWLEGDSPEPVDVGLSRELRVILLCRSPISMSSAPISAILPRTT